MDDRFARQLKKGVLEMVVLGLVCARPTYGYELLTELEQRSGGLLALKEGTLYPILYRLEDEGLIAAAWQKGEGRTTPKKIYTVTEAGRGALAAQRAQWQEFSACIATFCEEDGE